MSEEKFFQQVKSGLYDYAPEVPSGVYSGMRRKLWMSNFLSWNWSSLNVWYVSVMIAAGASFFFMQNESVLKADKAIASPVQSSKLMVSATAATSEVATTTVATNASIAPSKRTMRKSSHTDNLAGLTDASSENLPSVTVPDCDLPKPEFTEPTLTTIEENPNGNEVIVPVAEKPKSTLVIDVYVGEK